MSNKFSRGIRVWKQRTLIILQGLKQVSFYALIIVFAWIIYRIFVIAGWEALYYWYVEIKAQGKSILARIINSKDLKVDCYVLGKGKVLQLPIAKYIEWFWQSDYGHKIDKLFSWLKYKALVELIKIFCISCLCGITIFALYGKKLFSKVKKGVELASLDELQKAMSKKVRKKSFKINKLKLAVGVERKHFLISGTTGAGKTNLLKYIVEEIRNRGEKAIIFDLTGELKNAFGEDGDIEINPFKKELPHYWSPFYEFSGEKNDEVVNIVKSLIPDSGVKGKDFFNEAGRAVLQTLFSKTRNITELRKIFINGKINNVLEGSLAAELLNDAKETAGSIKSTVVNSLKQLDPILDDREYNGDDNFSIKQWIKGSKKNWLFFTTRSHQRNSMRSILCIWADICIRALMETEGSARSMDENTWIVMDELAAFENIPSLSTGLAELRKYGGCIVGSLQNIAQLRGIYTHDKAQALIDLFGSKFVFRSGEFEIAKYFSELLGREDTIEKKESVNIAGDSKRDSVHIGENIKQDPIVTPSNILYLPDLTCYVKITGNFPVSKMQFAYHKK